MSWKSDIGKVDSTEFFKNLPKYVCQNVFYLVTVELGLAELDILAQCFSMSDQSNAYFSGLKHYPSHNWPFKINPCHIP